MEKKLKSCIPQDSIYVNILKTTNYRHGDEWFPGFRKGVRQEGNEDGYERDNTRDPYSNGNILYLDHINVSILVVTLYYSF